jgi:hypothetical protein
MGILDAVPSRFPRSYRRQLEAADRAKVDRLVEPIADDEPATAAGATARGDGRRLRGIPAVGRGSSSTMFGTDPLRALLAKEARRQR